jgi:hypothetical protein
VTTKSASNVVCRLIALGVAMDEQCRARHVTGESAKDLLSVLIDPIAIHALIKSVHRFSGRWPVNVLQGIRP